VQWVLAVRLLKKMALDESVQPKKRQHDQDNQPESGKELVGCCNQSFKHIDIAMPRSANFIIRP
jgi:hypothetical protein